MKNVMDTIDAIKANSVTENEFKSVWGISLNEHMNKMMEHVRETDARVKAECRNKKND
ncbi:MAG: hypothetical protein IJS97_03565 [Prevotella sp.]|nr:hypothetical protein [Prevotella sp.]